MTWTVTLNQQATDRWMGRKGVYCISLTFEAPTWFDARAKAMTHFGCGPGEFVSIVQVGG